jgi:hypothetical protein
MPNLASSNESHSFSPLWRRVALWLFLTLASVYLLGTGGHINTPDGVVMLRVTNNLLERGAVDLETDWIGKEFGVFQVEDPVTGERLSYAKYGLGYSLASVPGNLLGRLLFPLTGANERRLFDTARSERDGEMKRTNPFRVFFYDVREPAFRSAFISFTTSLTNALVVAAIVALIFLTCGRLGFGLWSSFATAAMAGFATPLWHYSKTSFSEPLAGLALLLFFFCAISAKQAPFAWRWLFFAGLALGCSVLVKPAHAVELIPAGLLLAVYARRMQKSAILRSLLAFTLGLAIPVSLILFYNWVRFASPFETGYGAEAGRWTTPFLTGLYGLLFSSGRGLLVYFPAFFLTLLAIRRFASGFKAETVFLLSSLGVLLLLYSKWYMWEGGWCWGPRFLMPALPLCVLPSACLFERFWSYPTWQRAGLAVFLLACVGVAANGVIVDYVDFDSWIRVRHAFDPDGFKAMGVDNYYELLRWHWPYSALATYWEFPVKDYFLLPHAIRRPGLVLALYAVFLAGGAIGVVQLQKLLREQLTTQTQR